MKKETLKNLTHAHAWLGLIISGVLMIVFLCGTISFFRMSIIQWDKHYNLPAAQQGEPVGLTSAIEYVQNQSYNIPSDHSVFISNPTIDRNYYSVFFDTEGTDGSHERVALRLDTGTLSELPDERDQYYLANMLYRLHIDLLLPFGRELVGIVSLIFFVIVISGGLIHLKKMISHFYQYRLTKAKDTYLDGHNLIGVSSLPYTFLYALTGVMFNLAVVFQGGFGFAVFQGDIDKLLDTAGFPKPHDIEATGKPWSLDNMERILVKSEERYPKLAVDFVQIYGFADKDAVVEVNMRANDQLINNAILVYSLDDESLISEVSMENNAFSGVYGTLENLHVGEYGGVTLKFIYFALGLACCYLILTGNLIWLEKRERNKKQSAFGLRFVKAMTLSLSSGTLIAVASCFVATRFVDISYLRTDFLPEVFLFSLIIASFHAYFLNKARKAMKQQLLLATVLFVLCPLFDLLMLVTGSGTQHHIIDVWLVNIALGLTALFCFILLITSKEPTSANERKIKDRTAELALASD